MIEEIQASLNAKVADIVAHGRTDMPSRADGAQPTLLVFVLRGEYEFAAFQSIDYSLARVVGEADKRASDSNRAFQ
jgi:hypothetical protein